MAKQYLAIPHNSRSWSLVLHRPLTFLSALLVGSIASLVSLFFLLPFAPAPSQSFCPSSSRRESEARTRPRPTSPPPPSPQTHPLNHLLDNRFQHLERVDESEEEEGVLESSSVEEGNNGVPSDSRSRRKSGKGRFLKRLHLDHGRSSERDRSSSPETDSSTSTSPKSPRQSKSFLKSLFQHRSHQDPSPVSETSPLTPTFDSRDRPKKNDSIPFVRTRDLSNGHESLDGSGAKSLDLHELLEGWASQENMRKVSTCRSLSFRV